MSEITPVPGFSAYGVTKDGEVWRIKPVTGNGNYKSRPLPYKRAKCRNIVSRHSYVTIRGDDGVKVDWRVSRLILTVFVGPCPPGHEAAHWNGIPDDDRLENLRWATPKENARDKLRHGTHHRGERCVQAKLSNEDVRKIRLLASTVPIKELAARFGIAPMYCSRVARFIRRPYG